MITRLLDKNSLAQKLTSSWSTEPSVSRFKAPSQLIFVKKNLLWKTHFFIAIVQIQKKIVFILQ